MLFKIWKHTLNIYMPNSPRHRFCSILSYLQWEIFILRKLGWSWTSLLIVKPFGMRKTTINWYEILDFKNWHDTNLTCKHKLSPLFDMLFRMRKITIDCYEISDLKNWNSTNRICEHKLLLLFIISFRTRKTRIDWLEILGLCQFSYWIWG